MYKDSTVKFVHENWYKQTAQQIAKALGTSENTVFRIAAKTGLPKKKSNEFIKVLEQNNFNPPTWKDGWLKTQTASIRIVNKENLVSYHDIRNEQIRAMKKHAPKYKKIKRGKTEPHLLLVDLGDIHINKAGAVEETGEEYNTNIAIERAKRAVTEILSRAKTYNIEKIVFNIGGDTLNTDNRNSTTSGTLQDTDTHWHRAFKIARKLYVETIEQMVQVADVHVIHNPANHDWYSGFMLADALYCWFNKHPQITFDITNAHRKYFRYGENLIGTSHGDSATTEQLPMLMATEAKQYWAKTTYRYIYLHHIHHKKQIKYLLGQDKQQITIEYMRSPSGPDRWHSYKGYISPKSIEGFIHHKTDGQVGRITINF